MSSKKIFIMGTDGCSWSIDRDRENIINIINNSDKLVITSKIPEANVIYCVWYDFLTNILENRFSYYSLLIQKKIRNIKLIAVITNDVQRTPEKIDKMQGIVDLWVAPSSKIYNFIKNLGLKVTSIPFLVDKSVFRRLNYNKTEICKKLEINPKLINNRFLIGSFQRDSLGADLTKPKWQKNPDLLVNILKELPSDKYLLILAGPRRHYIINQCKKFGISYLFIGDEMYIKEGRDDLISNNLPLEKINLLYNLIDLYIVSSKSEGGPKAILESSLTKTLIFSTDVGLASDILHPQLIFSESKIDELIDEIHSLIKTFHLFRHLIDYNYKKVLEILDEEKILNKILAMVNEV